jgi:poly(A) polymerase
MDERGRVASDLVRRLRAAGYETYLAGGCVRDRLLGREPGDWDVATAAPPETVRKLFRRTVGVGAAFGVILVLEGDDQFEVATFRSDDAYVDGRHPSAVHFATAEKDAQRRDFTINALFQDPETGEVIDFVGGQADLRAGVVRAIGDAGARIAEDRLRMLRAVRFAARLGFALEPATRQAIVAAAPTLVDIAAERIGDEVV